MNKKKTANREINLFELHAALKDQGFVVKGIWKSGENIQIIIDRYREGERPVLLKSLLGEKDKKIESESLLGEKTE